MILPIILMTASALHIEMGNVQARLFYSESGRLSDDVLARKTPFVFWNTIIGEGDAEEKADDLLISITLSTGKFGRPEENEQRVGGPLTLRAINSKGKILASRSFKDIFTGKSGSITLPLWLNDVGCAGDVAIEARLAGRLRSAKLQLACGE